MIDCIACQHCSTRKMWLREPQRAHRNLRCAQKTFFPPNISRDLFKSYLQIQSNHQRSTLHIFWSITYMHTYGGEGGLPVKLTT